MWKIEAGTDEIYNVVDVNCSMQGRYAHIEIELSANLAEECVFLELFLEQETSGGLQLPHIDIFENGEKKFSGPCFIQNHNVYFTKNDQREYVLLRPKGEFEVGEEARFQEVNS